VELRVHAPLPTRVHGSVALVGDACHPALPHLVQGAAQAIEDAAVLGVVLVRMPDRDPHSINKALRVYERLRKPRAETLIDLTAANDHELRLGEGAAKEERDKQFAALKRGKGPVPDKWADAGAQRMIYRHDSMQVTQASFDKLFQRV
jgi:salicylate hydroxylase